MNHEITRIKASELVEDFSLYPRNSVFDGHVFDLAEAIRGGAVMPPCRADLKSKRVTDGFHRRRGTIKVYGPDAEVDVVLVDYASDGDMVRDSISLNSTHGRRLTTADIARCALLAEKFKITRTELAGLLHIERATLKGMVDRRVAHTNKGEPIVVRRPMQHFAGRKLTKRQVEAVPKVGGQPAIQLVRQLCELIESNSLPDDEKLFEALRKLNGLLDGILCVK